MNRLWKQLLTMLLALVLIAVFVPSGISRSKAEAEHQTINWELKKIDGGTINYNSFGNKTVLLVFFRISGCSNSDGTVTGLLSSSLMDNPDLQIVLAEFDGYDVKYVKQYLDITQLDYSKAIVAYDGRSLAYELSHLIEDDGSITFSNCAILRGNEILDYWEGNYYAGQINQHLAALEGGGSNQVYPISGRFWQSEARKQLQLVNEFRQTQGVWEWCSNNTDKTYYNKPGCTYLGTLTYDYDLEQIAMQRAKELVLYFSHTRPTGEDCFSLKVNGTQSHGENIALGYPNAQSVFTGFREEDRTYEGQGHRRNMLKEGYTAVGFGCFVYGGTCYWVQEFGYSPSGASATPANDARDNNGVEYSPFFLNVIDAEIEWDSRDVKYKGNTAYVIANGYQQAPRFSVKNKATGKTISSSDYYYKYQENTAAGTGYLFVTMLGGSNGAGAFRGTFKIYLPATKNTTVANVKDGIKLSWSKVAGADGYVIYRRAWSSTTNGWTDFVRWNNTKELNWLDTKVYAGTRYQYGIKAYFNKRLDPVTNTWIGGNVGDNFNLGEVGPLKTTVRITTRTLNSVTAGSKQMTVKWDASSQFTGYQVQYATDSAFTQNAKAVKITNPKTASTVIKSLLSGKTYYVRVRSYHEFNGMTYFGEWSNVKSCKVK